MIRNGQFELIKTQQVNKYLLCPICKEVFNKPIRAICGHTFCESCLDPQIKMEKSCSLCLLKLERYNHLDKDRIAANMIGDYQGKCLGCKQWEGTFAQFKKHYKSQCIHISTKNQILHDTIEIEEKHDNKDKELSFTFIANKQEQIVQGNQINENFGHIDQSQNLRQKQMAQQNQFNPPQMINSNNNHFHEQFNKHNNKMEQNIEHFQKIVDNIKHNETSAQNNKETQFKFPQIQNTLIDQNNLLIQVELNTSQINQQNNQQQMSIQNQNSNLDETAEKYLQIQKQSLMLQNNFDQNKIINDLKKISQEQVQQVGDNSSNQIQIEINQENSNKINEFKQQNKSMEEQFKLNNPEVEIIDPPATFLNRDLKKIKVTNKFKINIIKNNVKIAEPMMDEINDNLFIEFVNYMKKEMVKKLSDSQYYNTLLG
ncbi:unnamed protein product [Paramecium sonneborni]|uniref:RING-type domain-containing protein n=1 Tax=Paramecium sonneborni TaxID=65129 RepID=A0A8S1RAR8_9CILI|nr:unnamed protein product [Paramecium sonneborni]